MDCQQQHIGYRGDGPLASGDVIAARVGGVLDLPGAAQIRSQLLSALAQAPTALLIDLVDLRLGDDVHLTVFAAATRHAAAWPGCRVILFNPSAPVAEALRTLRLQHLTVCATLSEALTELDRPVERESRVRTLHPLRCSPRAARDFVEQICRTWQVGEVPRSTLRQIASELVSNAVQHAGTDSVLHVRRTPRHLHIAVRDYQPAEPPAAVLPTHGLGLVDTLAASWGVLPMPDGKVVWATVHCG